MAVNNNHFQLTLDTQITAGSFTIAPGANATGQYINYTDIIFNITSSVSDHVYMKVWLTGPGDSDTTIPESPVWEAISKTKTISLGADAAEGLYIGHVCFMDSIGNEVQKDGASGSTSAIIYDKTAPTITSATITDPEAPTVKGETNQLTNNLTVVFSDTNGVSKLVISGADVAETKTINNPVSGTAYSFDFKNTITEGSHEVTVTLTDKAGNTSKKTASIYYDPEARDVSLILFKDADHTQQVTNYTNINTIYPRISQAASSHKDIVAYKIWGAGIGITEEPEAWTDASPEGADYYDLDAVTVTSAEGEKEVKIKVKDHLGNISDVVTSTFIRDTTKPTCSLTASVLVVSTNTDKDSTILTYSVADTGAGVSSWAISVGETTLASGTSEASSTLTVKASQLVSGANSIVLTATDNAGNTNTATVSITKDITAPTGATITSPSNQWYNTKPTITITGIADDTTETKDILCYIWVDTSASPSTILAGISPVSHTGSAGTISVSGENEAIGGTWSQSDKLYVHVVLEDKVGNKSEIFSKQFKYDTIKPTTPTTANFGFTKAYYGSTTAQMTFSFADSDATSGVAKIILKSASGFPGVIETVEFAATTSKTVTLTNTEGEHRVQVAFKDAAGNSSDWSEDFASTYLDTTAPKTTVVLYEPGSETTYKKTPTNILATNVKITIEDTAILEQGTGSYLLWEGGESDRPESGWVEFTLAEDKNYIFVAKTASAGTGDKRFSVVVRDASGNESAVATSAPFYYNPAAPGAYIMTDFYNISKVHTLRRSSATAVITEKYNDQVVIDVFIGDSTGAVSTTDRMKACKVCAYKTQAEAEAGTYEDTAIEGCTWNLDSTGTQAGSGTPKAEKETFIITGANYEKALNGGAEITESGSLDGAHFVVVYILNEANTWSGHAVFE